MKGNCGGQKRGTVTKLYIYSYIINNLYVNTFYRADPDKS